MKKNETITNSVSSDELDKLKKKLEEKEAKINQIEDQMSKLSSSYTDMLMNTSSDVETDPTSFLKIYVTLIEEVFGAAPHGKILFLLHGKKDVWNRTDIAKTTGIMGAVVLRSIYDLQKANLVHYDEETGNCWLTQKFY